MLTSKDEEGLLETIKRDKTFHFLMAEVYKDSFNYQLYELNNYAKAFEMLQRFKVCLGAFNLKDIPSYYSWQSFEEYKRELKKRLDETSENTLLGKFDSYL